MKKHEIKLDEEARKALKEIGAEPISEPEPEHIEDLSYGEDVRGDQALFIERIHINGWEVDEAVKQVVGDNTVFFRVLEHGIQQHAHGWIEEGRIFQWG